MNAKELGAQPAHPAEHVTAKSGRPFNHPGLTKREAFAMAAMQGILAGPVLGVATCALTVKLAVELADALILELTMDTTP